MRTTVDSLEDFLSAFEAGTLDSVSCLNLHNKKIGLEGAEALATALASGHCPG